MSTTCLSGQGDLGAQGGRIAKTHRAQTGAGDELARRGEFVILPGPHLVLAHAGGDDRLALGQFIERLDRHLRQDHFALAALQVVAHVLGADDFLRHAVAKRRARFPFLDLRDARR